MKRMKATYCTPSMKVQDSLANTRSVLVVVNNGGGSSGGGGEPGLSN